MCYSDVEASLGSHDTQCCLPDLASTATQGRIFAKGTAQDGIAHRTKTRRTRGAVLNSCRGPRHAAEPRHEIVCDMLRESRSNDKGAKGPTPCLQRRSGLARSEF